MRPRAATSEAVGFVVRRADGDWGDEAADHAAEHLTSFAREIPNAVAAHVDGMLGAILALCAPDQEHPAPERDWRGCDGGRDGTRIAAHASHCPSASPG